MAFDIDPKEYQDRLEALGFTDQADYEDHQRVIRASKDLAAVQLASYYANIK